MQKEKQNHPILYVRADTTSILGTSQLQSAASSMYQWLLWLIAVQTMVAINWGCSPQWSPVLPSVAAILIPDIMHAAEKGCDCLYYYYKKSTNLDA